MKSGKSQSSWELAVRSSSECSLTLSSGYLVRRVGEKWESVVWAGGRVKESLSTFMYLKKVLLMPG